MTNWSIYTKCNTSVHGAEPILTNFILTEIKPFLYYFLVFRAKCVTPIIVYYRPPINNTGRLASQEGVNDTLPLRVLTYVPRMGMGLHERIQMGDMTAQIEKFLPFSFMHTHLYV